MAEQGYFEDERWTKKSTYTQYGLEAERIVRMKETYESILLETDYLHKSDRERILRYAELLVNEAPYSFFTNDEKLKLFASISDLASIIRNIGIIEGSALDSKSVEAATNQYADMLKPTILRYS